MSPSPTYLTPTIPHSDLSTIKVDQMYSPHPNPMRHSILRFNRSSTTSNHSTTDFVSILSPPISPSGKFQKHHLNAIASAPVSRVSTPTPCSVNNSNIHNSGLKRSNSEINITNKKTCKSAASKSKYSKTNSRFPHHFPPMKSIDPPVYKPAPGTTESKFKELVEEKRRLDKGPAEASFADYSTDNFADSKSSSSLPMTSCAWDRCRAKNYLSNENANLHNYKRGIPVHHDPYSLAVHSINNKTKAQSAPSTPKRSLRARLSQFETEGVVTRSALNAKPTKVTKESVATTSNTPSRAYQPHDSCSGLAALGAAVLAITKQQQQQQQQQKQEEGSSSPLPPIRSIHGFGSTTLPSISSLSVSCTSQFNSPGEYYSNVNTPIQSPRIGSSPLSVDNAAATATSSSTSSHLRFVNSVSSTPKSTPKKIRKQGTPRKRTPPILSRVHDMEPQDLPDYTISADLLPSGKVLRAEWKGTPMDLTKDPNYSKIHPAEVNLAATLRLSVELYLDSKKRLFAEKVHRFKQGLPFRRTDSQKACRIDVNKASRLFMAYEKVGWLDDSNFEKYKNESLSVTSRI